MARWENEARRQRAARLRQERRVLRDVRNRYRDASRSIAAQLDEFAREVKRLEAAGEAPTVAWLRERRRVQRLAGGIEGALQRFAASAEGAMLAEVNVAAEDAAWRVSTIVGAITGERRTLVPTPVVERIVANTADATRLRTLLATISLDAGTAASAVLVDGIAAGKNPRALIGQLRRSLVTGGTPIPVYRAERIARTELLRAYREASLDVYRRDDTPVKGWVWHAEIDDCCGGCLAMHGEVFDNEDDFEAHPNCRCAMVPIVDGYENVSDGIPDEADALLAASSADALVSRFGRVKGEALASGQITRRDLVTRRANRTWGASRSEATVSELGLSG